MIPAHIVYGNEILKLVLSVLVGCILGLEREIRGKPAGFRTLALICFGATVFTICSYLLGVESNRDRIAANIITGIGFIGAGVIFRNNSSVSGITTAASIWVAAAIGMLLGIGQYLLAGLSLFFSLFILYALDFIQLWIDYKFEHRHYKLTYRRDCELDELNGEVKILQVTVRNLKIIRVDLQTVLEFDVTGREGNLIRLNQWFIKNDSIQSFDW